MKCKRCGWCCETATIAVSQSDILRWKRERRTDILREIAFIVNYPKKGRAGFYIAQTTKNPKQPCLFLLREDGLTSCGINDTKPIVCNNFPTTKPNETNCPIIAGSKIPPALTKQLNDQQAIDFKKTAVQHKQLYNILVKAREPNDD